MLTSFSIQEKDIEPGYKVDINIQDDVNEKIMFITDSTGNRLYLSPNNGIIGTNSQSPGKFVIKFNKNNI